MPAMLESFMQSFDAELKKMDVNSDGKLSHSELVRVVFKTIDHDCSGSITPK